MHVVSQDLVCIEFPRYMAMEHLPNYISVGVLSKCDPSTVSHSAWRLLLTPTVVIQYRIWQNHDQRYWNCTFIKIETLISNYKPKLVESNICIVYILMGNKQCLSLLVHKILHNKRKFAVLVLHTFCSSCSNAMITLLILPQLSDEPMAMLRVLLTLLTNLNEMTVWRIHAGPNLTMIDDAKAVEGLLHFLCGFFFALFVCFLFCFVFFDDHCCHGRNLCYKPHI